MPKHEMAEAVSPAFKLNYKIVGRREPDPDDKLNLQRVDVEWTHANGPIEDFILKPMSHPPDIKYEKVSAGHRDVIKDQIQVAKGTPDSVVAMMLEEKRERLAKALGVEP